ncbi:MAG: hypothetical protein LBB48_03815 [Treponema sp.]|nr:hypothetical protein [Treponema sp.]
MKRVIKAIREKMLVPVLDKLDKYLPSIMSVLSIRNPITEYPPAHGTLRKIQLAKANVLFAFDQFCKEKELRYWLHGGDSSWGGQARRVYPLGR